VNEQKEEFTPLPRGSRPGVIVNWPLSLDSWFRALLRRQPVPAPTVSTEEWAGWLRAVRGHGVSALVYSWLVAQPPTNRPPQPVMNQLQDEYILRTAQAGYRRTQLQRVLATLKQEQVEPILLKGAALAETEYGRPELRPSVDIDLLVPPADYARSKEALCRIGYQAHRGEQPRPMEWNSSEELLPHPGTNQISVELHWSLSPYAQVIREVDVQPLFERAAPVAGPASSFHILHTADALVHLCLHLLYKHPHLVRLIWLHDIHLLAQRIKELATWQEVIQLSIRWQGRLAVAEALALAADWFGTTVPPLVGDLQQWPPLPQEAAVYDYAVYRYSQSRRKAWLRKHLFQLTSLNGRRRFAYLLNRFFPTRAEIDSWYPALRSWPYPLAFFGRLLLAFLGKRNG
jgi:hypothetical protein